MASRPRLFEMRRMEALSNTIFGVAMTLLAFVAPAVAAGVDRWEKRHTQG
jgi:hypothetical protein